MESDKDHEQANLLEKPETSNYCRKLKGIAAMVAWDVSVVISDTSCQLLQRKIPDFELNMLRFLVSVLYIVPILMYQRQMPRLSKSQIGPFVGLAVFNFITTQSAYTAVSMAPVASVRSICTTSVIISGMILLYLFAGEQITARRIFTGFCCIAGVILVVQPDFIFAKKYVTGNKSNFNITMATETEGYETIVVFTILGHVLPIVTGMGVTAQIILVKRFPFLGEEVFTVGFWSLSSGAVISAALMAIFETPTFIQNLEEFAYLMGHCVTYGVIWLSTVLSSKYISGNAVNIFFSCIVVLMLIPQYTVLSSIYPGNRNWIEVFGVVLVLVGSCLGSLFELWLD